MVKYKETHFKCWVIAFALITTLGCTPKKVSISTPAVQGVQRDTYEIRLEPLKKGGTSFRYFLLTIVNKSDQAIEIDWHESSYLYNGKKYGMLLSRDTVPGQVRDPDKRFEKIGANQTYSKDIAPMRLIAYATARDSQRAPADEPVFSAGPMPPGQSGVLLVFKQGETPLREPLTVDIVEEAAVADH